MKRFILICVLVPALLAVSCKPAEMNGQPGAGPSPDGKLTLEEASRIIGLPVPAPAYLPEGYEITSVELEGHGALAMWDVTITIEAVDTVSAQPTGPLAIEVNWLSLGLKLPPGVERVMVGDSSAVVSRHPDHAELAWIDSAGREVWLTGNAELSFEELLRIAESVASPPARVLEASLEPADDLLVLRGESRRLVIHLQNNSTKYLKVSVSQDEDLPEGIGVTVHDDSLTLGPQESLDIPVDVIIGDDTPSPTWPHREVSYVLPTNPPPPLSGAITEPPRYHLQFSVSYSYSTWADTVVQDHTSLSTRLRIDPPTALPPGMVTLAEAETAADFPVAMLLPQYLPEGISPPPMGYAVSPEEPYSITVFYPGFRVVLSPEPDVSSPPEDVVGERTTIRTKKVVIGEGRIDWWADDIHRVVISKEIPMPELKLVAESMMLIGVASGSWLGVGE